MVLTDIAAHLDRAIKQAGIAIEGVSIGNENDRSTWCVRPSALQAQAQPLIDAFTVPTPATLLDEEAVSTTSRKELRAVAQGLWECIPAPTMTKAQLQMRIIAIYKALP